MSERFDDLILTVDGEYFGKGTIVRAANGRFVAGQTEYDMAPSARYEVIAIYGGKEEAWMDVFDHELNTAYHSVDPDYFTAVGVNQNYSGGTSHGSSPGYSEASGYWD